MATKKVSKKVETPEPAPKGSEKKSRWGLILFGVALLIILVFALTKNKNLIIVATVDGQPLWRSAFEQRVVSQVGKKTLEDMISEQLILNEAKKRGVSVTENDVNAKIAEIEKTLPKGTSLSDALAGQGMTMSDLNRQVTLQLTLEKLVGNDFPISDKEISTYLEQNKDFLQATDEASMTQEAKQAILNDKRNSKFKELFDNLQKNAQVNRFL